MDFNSITPISIEELQERHSKVLYRSICVPSTVQAYSLCIEYMKKWFLSKFPKDTFKSIYVDGKNIYDEFRSLDKIQLLKREKPSLAIIPAISWDFNNEHIDSYPYGMDLYTQTGKFKESFFSCHDTNSHLGIGMETLMMGFNFRIRVETRAQQLDMYKLIKLVCRVGFTCGEDVDLDFHIPYLLMMQLAKDNGFRTFVKDTADGPEETIEDIPAFLNWLNMHSSLPFLYKYRALNGKNEFFLRLRNMYVHVRPTDLSADDGERESQMTNNFTIDLQTEVRFPAPKMYAYYSESKHELQTVYGAWFQPNGPVSSCYAFKSTTIPDENSHGWPLLLSTTYEEDIDPNQQDKTLHKLEIDLSELMEGEVGNCIKETIAKGLSPSIFCEFVFYNGAEYIRGKLDWETMVFTSEGLVRENGTYIGIYVDNAYITDCMTSVSGKDNRLQKS